MISGMISIHYRYGHFNGMARPMVEKGKAPTDKWGYPIIYTDAEDAERDFNAAVAHALAGIELAADASAARSGKPLADCVAAISNIQPPPHRYALFELKEVSLA